MANIVLVALNARYQHSAFGLRYLLANLAELRPQATLLEFEQSDLMEEVAEAIAQQQPRIIGLSVYIWNVEAVRRLLRLLKCIAPHWPVVLGGPEVSHETAEQSWLALADYVICGEGEEAFVALCRSILAGTPPPEKILHPPLPDLERLVLPYAEYSTQDIAQRVIYVERARGCPYRCAFCLSALDERVRLLPRQKFLQAMADLLARGVRQFKFVDRTFNLALEESVAILDFFRAHLDLGLFIHLEMVPDRLPLPLRALIVQFPPGTLQFEVGIQSFNPEVQARIDRRWQRAESLANLRWLVEESGVHLHTDLIIGLPGESLASFADGFDQLLAINPQEIQVGILKRLRGAPIARYSAEFAMVYNPDPPYDLLANDQLDFLLLRRLKRFARYWDLFGNSGRFQQVRTLFGQQGSAFGQFLQLSDWLYATIGRTHAISLRDQFSYLQRGLTEGLGWDAERVQTALIVDFQHSTLHDPPDCLKGVTGRPGMRRSDPLPARQRRHHSAT
ncbi:MAG: DUF4080 domain-containing protein [Magnetococcales bacterium]|nr:DUF4080 domain-containing protein [Magnetococcales bacterium]MBF0116566.1 DUF4080 domain-containing protein [Magnetococcales bacterium]